MKTFEEQLEEFEDVKYRIKEEGMDYTFDGYSSWDNIDDEEFHKLRKEYLQCVKKLKNYIDNKIKELSEKTEYTCSDCDYCDCHKELCEFHDSMCLGSEKPCENFKRD